MSQKKRREATESEKASRKPIVRVLLAGIVILLVAVAFNIFISQNKDKERLRRLNAELQQQKKQLEEQQEALSQEVRMLGTPEYLERVAREQLGMISPSDIIITWD